MKKFLTSFAIIYTISSMLSFTLAGIFLRFDQFELASPSAIFFGTFLIALLISTSLRIYHTTWGNGILNVILAYLITFPVPFILQFMYRNLLFRVFRGIYILLGIYVFFYTIFLLYHHVKNKHSQTELNRLLSKDKTKKE